MKKRMTEITNLKNMIWEKAKRPQLANYVWDAVVGPQLGYSFSDIHSVSYSFIGAQTAYCASHWNPIFWDTACLIVNAGALEDAEEDDEETSDEEKEEETSSAPKKKDYGKIASAIGAIRDHNIKVSLVDINKSDFSFSPDEENNQILFGLKGLSNVGDDVVNTIIANRPYANIKDFMERCHIKRTSVISLIKAGAFDNISDWATGFKDIRKANMGYFIYSTCGLKNRLTLQNYNGLLQKGLIPDALDTEKRIYNFNKYLKTRKRGNYYVFDAMCYSFYEKHFDIDALEVISGETCIGINVWKKMYESSMDIVRDWLKNNKDEILFKYNSLIFKEDWDKYASESIADWEMDSMCFYYSDHPLKNIDKVKYGLVDFNTLSPDSDVERYITRKGKEFPIYKLSRIVGTVINKNDTRSSIDLLTPTGVVKVKFTKEYYANYKRRISEIAEDGKKKVKENGWFTRGNKLMCTGYRREDTFVCKTYKDTPTHQLYKIVSISNNGTEMELEHERYQVSNQEG